MRAIAKIYLSWRKGKGSRRMVVGEILKNATEGVRFRYYSEAIPIAQKEGFTPYVDFPDISKTYTENVLDIFGQRLIKAERPDIQKYLDFWDIDLNYQDDKYYLLAYTQGMLSTDNFEFLAEFHPIKELQFVSEICGLSHYKVESGSLQVGDFLSYELENNNPNDRYAVKIKKGSKVLGYVKIVHSKVFYKVRHHQLSIRVKSIDQNGSVNRVFIEISF